MRKFISDDFLLNNEVGKNLYHNYAKEMPIIDYHCHIDPKEIYENRKFENITQLWLGQDHYKWRQMRSNGVEEKFVTGDASDYEKFEKWAQTLEKLIGNPLYHWSHLELKRYFGYDGTLGKDNVKEVWEFCNEKLKDDALSVRNIIKNSNVNIVCTTDDPIDDLKWHKAIKEDTSIDTIVLPTWRPDKAMNIEKASFLEYIELLEKAADLKINNFRDLKDALVKRLHYFDDMGCRASDHGINYVSYVDYDEKEIAMIFDKRLNNEAISKVEEIKYKTAFMMFMASEYHALDWAMQLHYGCKRDNNKIMFQKLGPDTGYDCIDDYAPANQLANFLDALNTKNALPKTILYSLNPNDNAIIDTVMCCFQEGSTLAKMQHGAPWWFNDHKAGMEEHLISLGNLGVLANFIGMLTDSRSFLSYTRHEYFRRILCNVLGKWVEDGEYPKNYEILKEIVENISYNNAIAYFGYK